MKIVQVSLRFDAPGGVETTVRELARELRARGDEVAVFASDLVDEASWSRGVDFRPSVDDIPVRRFPVRRGVAPGVSLPWMVGLGAALRTSGADLIHAHSHRYGHVLQAAAAARRAGIPLVVSTHYHPADPWEPRWKRPLLRAEDLLFGASAYRSAGAVVVESAREAELVGAFAPRDRLRVIPPGIDLGEWADPAGDRARAPALPPSYLLYAGRLAANKGLPVLFEALARLPPPERTPLVLMGPPWGENPALEALARRLEVDQDVRWLGNVPERAAYRAVLRGASALLLPSAWEAYGLVLLDAMAAGVPIVASDRGAIPEVLDQGRCGRLVPYGDPGALAAALRELRQDPEAAGRRVAAASERVRALTWSASAERFRALYRSLGS
ncbi:MAG TPA: glycosyltransferase family 4 protein [Thermoplasmata archaeon]|nr:glycosyltransferase family 4 protein [Thermoplasmata archaeon]